MDTEELRDYLTDNSNIENLFTSKCLQYLTEKNNQRSLDKRWPQERIDREAANMYYKFLVNIHDKISSNFKGLAKHDPNKWRHFISVNEVLDQLEESVVELDFE